MDDFLLYFSLGLDHIISPDALDHQLFLLAMVAGFTPKDWKPLLVLITAFTLGHSLTLALSSSGEIRISSYWIEVLIPVTILLSGFGALFLPGKKTSKLSWLYPAAGLFGLIHGMGFANTLKSMLGKEQSLLMPLFGFNTGLELGQLMVVVVWISIFGIIGIWYRNHALLGRISGLLAVLGSVWMIIERV